MAAPPDHASNLPGPAHPGLHLGRLADPAPGRHGRGHQARRLLPPAGAAGPRQPGQLDGGDHRSPGSTDHRRPNCHLGQPPDRQGRHVLLIRRPRQARGHVRPGRCQGPGGHSDPDVARLGGRPGRANGTFSVPLQGPPKRGQARDSITSDPAVQIVPDEHSTLGDRGHAVQSVHLPGVDPRPGDRPAHRRRDHRVHRVGRRRVVPGPPVHDPAPPADDGGPRSRAGRARKPRPDQAGGDRCDRDLRAVPPVQRDGRSARGERRDHPPGPRPEPRLPRRRVPRAADPDHRPADVERAAQRVGWRRSRTRGPSSSSRAVSSSSGSTGWPRTCSSCRSSTPGWSCSISGRTTSGPLSSRRSSRPTASANRRGVSLRLEPAAEPGPDPPRSPADRPGRDEPGRQRAQVHPARRVGQRRARAGPRGCPDRGPRHRRRDRRRPSCPGSSTGSTAGRWPTRRAAAAAGSAWRSSSRSSTCTPAGSRWTAGSVRARPSRLILPLDPRAVAETPRPSSDLDDRLERPEGTVRPR